MKIFVDGNLPEGGIGPLKEKGYEIDVWNEGILERNKFLDLIKQKPYDALVTLLTDKVDAEVFDACPTAKIIANYAVGFNNIDVAEAEKRGIVVTNTPGCLDCAVAEHAVALMLALSLRIVEGDRFVRDGKFKGWLPDLMLGNDLCGKKIGIVGMGRIGLTVSRILRRGFDCNIIYHSPERSEIAEKEFGAEFKESLADLLKEADVISLHVPLNPATVHLINKNSFAQMKKTAMIINTSRGPVIDEKALVDALKEGIVAGAALDVYEFEPELSPGLADLPNVVLTPHSASARVGARNEMAKMAAENLISFFETGKPVNPVK